MPSLLMFIRTKQYQSGLFVLLLAITGCNNSSRKADSKNILQDVKVGMHYLKVLELAGFPDTILHVGIMTDEFSNQTKTDEWYYSANSIVIMVNDTVNAIDFHANETRTQIQRIIDSAKAAEGSNSPLIQPGQE